MYSETWNLPISISPGFWRRKWGKLFSQWVLKHCGTLLLKRLILMVANRAVCQSKAHPWPKQPRRPRPTCPCGCQAYWYAQTRSTHLKIKATTWIKIQSSKNVVDFCLVNIRDCYLRWPHLPRPDRRPDATATRWATRSLPATRLVTRFSTWPKCENLVAQSGCLQQSGRQMKLASVHIYLIGPDIWPKGSSSFQNLVAQEPSGHPLGRQSIWSPIRSPEHLVTH